MAFLVGGANSAADTGPYDIDNSCRFETDTYMTKSISSGNTRTFTLSFWVKRTTVSSGLYGYLASFYQDSNNRISIGFYNDDAFFVYAEDGGVARVYLKTDRLFRDPAAWYHIAIAIDTTQGTDTNRAKLYVNGVQETSFSTATYPDEDQELILNTNFYVGTSSVTSGWFGGHMAEYVYIDGTALAPSSFGETDEDSGIWKPIDVSGLTFGTNGFYLDFEASGNLGNDANGGTDLTETNLAATDQCTDTPTNNFCTLNPLNQDTESLSEGNLKIQSRAGGSGNGIGRGTIGFSSGKWYAEYLYLSGDVGAMPGISPTSVSAAVSTGHFYAFHNGNKIRYVGTTYTDDGAFGDTLAADDILGIAMDADNNTIAFYKNNVLQGGGNAYTGLTDEYTFSQSTAGGTENYGVWNFGNSPVALDSGNADANGYGNFEYEPPNGFYALCTKNLAEYG